MAITQAMCSSFKSELFGAVHDMNTDDIKIALYTSAATLNAATTGYSTSNEVVGVGYTAGGQSLSNVTITLSGTTAFVDFDDVTWPSSTITARGALVYNASKANRAIATYDFGQNVSTPGGNFVVEAPPASSSTAVIRIV